MIITKKDNTGRVIAYAEFRLVNETGSPEAQGVYAWINDVWVHESLRTRNRFNSILEHFITSYSKRFPSAKYIYWQRGKHKDRMSLYYVDKIIRRIHGRLKEEERRSERSAAAGTITDTYAVRNKPADY